MDVDPCRGIQVGLKTHGLEERALPTMMMMVVAVMMMSLDEE